MSASNAAAEPSMEEILSSIRQAINEDIPGAVPETSGDPFASGSSAEAAFSSPPPGQAFDATVHESHDPFAELTRKLNETRESVQKQMHGVSSNLRSEQPEAGTAQPAPEAPAPQVAPAPPAPSAAQHAPAPAPVVPTPPVSAPAPAPQAFQPPPAQAAPKPEPHPIRAAVFSAEPEDEQSSPVVNKAEASGGLAALTARVADEFRASNEASSSAPTPPVAEAPATPEPAIKPQMPELSWGSATRAAPEPTEPAARAEPTREAPPEVAVAPKAEPKAAPKVEAKAAVDPFPKLTAIVERGSPEKTTSAKTDDAMVDLVLRRILEPAVKSWLDENLPKIVTEVVREEVRRVADQAK